MLCHTQWHYAECRILYIVMLNAIILSVIGRYDTQHNEIKHNGASYGPQHNSTESHNAECRDYLNVMLSVVMLNVVMECC